MSDFHFTPTQDAGRIKVPFYEEARADFAPHYDIRNKTLAEVQGEVTVELAKLGAGNVMFQEGYFGERPRRFGYRIRFQYGGQQGMIRVAGLAMRGRTTEVKLRKIRLQALMNVRDQLKAAVTSRVFSPGSDTLIQYLLVDGRRTFVDVLSEEGHVPLLGAPEGDFVEGEIV